MRALIRRRFSGRSIADEFDALALGRAARDRHELFAELRKREPLLRSPKLAASVLSRYADVRALLESRDFGHVTRGPGMTVLQGGFQSWSGREHSKKMGIVGRRLRSARALREEARAKVELVIHDLVERLPLDEEIDLKQAFTERVPLLVFCQLAALDDPEALDAWATRMIANAAGGSYEDLPLVGAASLSELQRLIGPVVAERRRRPGEDLISDLATAEYEGRPFPDAELTLIVAQLFVGMFEAERLLTSALRQLMLDSDLTTSLRDRRADLDILASFGAEVLRIFTPIQAVTRRALTDTRIGDYDFHANDTVIGLLASANRDSARFSDPDTFDADRFGENPTRQFTPSGDILPFGAGEHFCTGARLGQLMVVHAVRGLLDRVGSLVPAGEAPFVGGLMSWSPTALPVVLRPPR